MQRVPFVKQVYGRSTYTKVIDTKFSELYTEVTASSANNLTVESFFDAYEALFFQIPANGETNSHEYLVKRSSEYLGGAVITDREQLYIDEINNLRQQLLEANASLIDLNNVI